MNNQGRSIIDRRGILLSLAAVGVAAVLLWFSMIGGVGATSADGGGPNSASQVGQATQQYGDQPPVNACLLPIWIPCPDPRG